MRNYLKTRTTDKRRAGIPPEAERTEIMLELLKRQHFEGIWYNGLTIGVRRFADGAPEYLSWSEAVRMLGEAPERKARKGPGFAVTTNPQNPPASWNEMNSPMVLVLSPKVRARIKPKRIA